MEDAKISNQELRLKIAQRLGWVVKSDWYDVINAYVQGDYSSIVMSLPPDYYRYLTANPHWNPPVPPGMSIPFSFLPNWPENSTEAMQLLSQLCSKRGCAYSKWTTSNRLYDLKGPAKEGYVARIWAGAVSSPGDITAVADTLARAVSLACWHLLELPEPVTEPGPEESDSKEQRLFNLATVLSITTGLVLIEFNAIHEALEYLMGGKLFTHQLSMVSDICTKKIYAKYPQLNEVDAKGVDEENWQRFLEAQIEKYGNEFWLEPLTNEERGWKIKLDTPKSKKPTERKD